MNFDSEEYYESGQVAIYIVVIFLMVIIIVFAVLLAPMGILFNTEMYKAGETILQKANSSLQQIQDTDVKNTLQNQLDTSFEAQQNNIEVNNAMFKYSWVLILGLTAIVAFLFTRQTTEFGRGFV